MFNAFVIVCTFDAAGHQHKEMMMDELYAKSPLMEDLPKVKTEQQKQLEEIMKREMTTPNDSTAKALEFIGGIAYSSGKAIKDLPQFETIRQALQAAEQPQREGWRKDNEMKKLTQAQKIDAIYDLLITKQTPKPASKYFRLGNIDVYDKNMPVMTYVDMVKAVEALGDRWTIPTLEQVSIQYANKDTVNGEPFCTTPSGSDYPHWYWSSTPDRNYPTLVVNVRFSNGYELCLHKDNFRLSCRPVRLAAAPGL